MGTQCRKYFGSCVGGRLPITGYHLVIQQAFCFDVLKTDFLKILNGLGKMKYGTEEYALTQGGLLKKAELMQDGKVLEGDLEKKIF